MVDIMDFAGKEDPDSRKKRDEAEAKLRKPSSLLNNSFLTAEMKRWNRQASERSDELANAKLSITLTAIAAVAALFALLISLAAYRLAFSDDEHDRRWRAEQRQLATEQLRVLQEIRERLPVSP